MNKAIIIPMLILLVGCIPQTPEEELEWCLKYKPQFNSSSIGGLQTDYNIELGQIQKKCFTEYWDEYCKVSYPEHCPNNEYSDYDRCIRNCEAYGMFPCPC